MVYGLGNFDVCHVSPSVDEEELTCEGADCLGEVFVLLGYFGGSGCGVREFDRLGDFFFDEWPAVAVLSFFMPFEEGEVGGDDVVCGVFGMGMLVGGCGVLYVLFGKYDWFDVFVGPFAGHPVEVVFKAFA